MDFYLADEVAAGDAAQQPRYNQAGSLEWE
jgi:hypothetical protein